MILCADPGNPGLPARKSAPRVSTGPRFQVKTAPMTQEMMKERLSQAYPDANVEVYDLTGTQDHWEVLVESKAFAGMTRIQQHQAVMAVFGPELKTGEVHALSIKTKLKA